ncbi:hypothetical protein GGS26DRAFT_592703 [Hypomontagnella submonticulosa]|nr:hypothetical protein GGS26DRAFT_592703 [Hypomontagnella submonticulosa]
MEVGRHSSGLALTEGRYKITNECKDVYPEVNLDNQGWAVVGNFEVRKFRGRRAHAPKPLFDGGNVKFHEINFRRSRIVSTITLAQPGFDWGLGCFGNPTKVVETGKGELNDLHWSDFHEVRISKELAEGHEVWGRGIDDWLMFQRSTQRNEELKTEQELIDFHEEQQLYQEESYQGPVRRHSSDTKRFLNELRNLESAHPKVQDEEVVVPAIEKGENKNPAWVLRGFGDWIDEADFVESHAGIR